MSNTSVGFDESSKVLGQLGGMSNNPRVAAAFTLASIGTGIVGSIFGAQSGSASAAATARFRKEVVDGLQEINQKLAAIKQDLGTIERELLNIDNQLKDIKDMTIAEQLGIIDGFYQDFISTPDAPDGQKQLEKLSKEAFDPSSGVVAAMNKVNELITTDLYGTSTALQGQMSVAGYLYIRAKLVHGLYILGYACNFTEYDFGSIFMIWSQHFAEHMKTIISYGKANPQVINANLAQFGAYWGAVGLENPDPTHIYTSDSIPFSITLADTMPCKMTLVSGTGYKEIVYYPHTPFYNRFNSLVSAPPVNGNPSPILMSSFESVFSPNPTNTEVPYTSPLDGSSKSFHLDISKEESSGPAFDSPFDAVYSMNGGQGQEFEQEVLVCPKIAVDPGNGIYLGSVDGILNYLPSPGGSEESSVTAFLYDGTTKQNLLSLQSADGGIDPVPMESLQSLKYCAVDIIFASSPTPTGPGTVYVRFSETRIYLNVYHTPEGKTIWVQNGETPVALEVTNDIVPKKVESPYDMPPAYIYLNNGGYKLPAVVHISPFN